MFVSFWAAKLLNISNNFSVWFPFRLPEGRAPAVGWLHPSQRETTLPIRTQLPSSWRSRWGRREWEYERRLTALCLRLPGPPGTAAWWESRRSLRGLSQGNGASSILPVIRSPLSGVVGVLNTGLSFVYKDFVLVKLNSLLYPNIL